MASELTRDELQRLARLGAERRLEELRREEASILSAFPELGQNGSSRARQGGERAASPAASTDANGGASTAPAAPVEGPRRPRMSAAQRRAVSARMRKYWADRRKASDTGAAKPKAKAKAKAKARA